MGMTGKWVCHRRLARFAPAWQRPVDLLDGHGHREGSDLQFAEGKQDELIGHIRELRPLLFQLAQGDVPVAFDFKCHHDFLLLLFVCILRDATENVPLISGKETLVQ